MEASSIDAICIFNSIGERFCTDFKVYFHRLSSSGLNLSSIFGFSQVMNEKYDNNVLVYCNDTKCDKITAFVGSSGQIRIDMENNASFPSATLSNTMLQSMPFVLGANDMRFVHEETGVATSFILYFWSCTDKMAVIDIDGTITKSDVR